MKAGKIFWGTLFVTVGVLVLLGNLGVVTFELGFVWLWWPVLLILAGVALVVRSPIVKGVAAAVAAIALGVILVSILNFSWFPGKSMTGPVVTADTLTEPYDPSVKRALFTLDTGAGSFFIGDTAAALVTAVTRSNLGTYSLQRVHDTEREQISLSLESGQRPRFWKKMQNQVDVRLSPAPVWDLAFDVGAAKVELDLTSFIVQNLDLDCGAASITATLGDRSQEMHVSIDAGASSIKLRVPESAGCEVKLHAPLSSKKLSGFEMPEKNLYRTENFGEAKKKVYVEIEAGVSRVKVERY